MSERTAPLDRRRRIHLGILRNELRGRSYERFFRWEMDPLPAEAEDALRRGEADARDVLPRDAVNRLLEPGTLPLENGWAQLADGTTFVAARTDFPGATAEMIDWWFAWHGEETERYKLWHPQAHLFTQWRHPRGETAGLSDRERYLGNTSYVDEYVGPTLHRLAIRFVPPEEFGFDVDAFEKAGVGTVVCARVGSSDGPVELGHLAHLMRETPTGCEMRSRFWLGDVHLRGFPEPNPLDGVLGAIGRRFLLPPRAGRDLFIHCVEEMNHLASFLPELHAQETSG